MSTVSELHTKAMDLAENAFLADRKGEYETARQLFSEGFILEREAAEQLIDLKDAEPTRSILLNSAAALALHCHEYREAERLVFIALIDEPPASVANDLRELLSTISFRRHLFQRGVELDPSEVHLLLDGPAVGHGITPSKPFVRRTEISETLLVRTVERMKKVPFRAGTSPSRSIARDYETYLAAPLAGSFGITIRVGRPIQGQQFFKGSEFVSPANAIEELMCCMASFAKNDRKELTKQIQDQVYFDNFVNLARRLAPDGRGITHVGLSSRLGNEEMRIEMSGSPSPMWTENDDDKSDILIIQGRINAADDRFTRKTPTIGITDNANNKHQIYVPVGLLDDIVRPLWHEEVVVTAKRGKRNRVELIDIEAADADEE